MLPKLVLVLTLLLAAELTVCEKRVERFGMEMAVKSFQQVCWWEYTKRFPQRSSNDGTCSDSLRYLMWQLSDPESSNQAINYPDMWVGAFGKYGKDHMNEIPEMYGENCEKYLTDATAKPKYNESKALEDEGKRDYPFQAFAYCLLHTLRSRHGDEAINDLKEPRPKNKGEWEKDMIKRHNQYRDLHGVPPLKLLPELSAAAQSWADYLTSVCKFDHNNGTTPEYRYKGEMVGENLHGGNDDDFANTGMSISDSWYQEVKYYPFPDGWHGQNDEDWKHFGHFTQVVWKNTKFAGFGFSYNEKCKEAGSPRRVVVGRYYPPGNVQGTWPDNVLPPKDT